MFFSMSEAQTSSGEREVHPADGKGMIFAQVGSRQQLVMEVGISEKNPGKNPPWRLQTPSREASTPWSITRYYTRNKGLNIQFGVLHGLALMYRAGKEEERVEWRSRRERFAPVSGQGHSSQAPVLPCPVWVSLSSSALRKPKEASNKPSCSDLPKVTASPP